MNNKMKHYYVIVISFIAILLISCSDGKSKETDYDNSIYYWRTTFTLNDAEKEFLKKHDVNKIYMRFFDVVCDVKDEVEIVPEATISFIDSIPEDIDIIPTIFITTSAIYNMETNEEIYAEKIFRRVRAMCLKNNISFKELQLDCDWTENSRKCFFALCEAVKNRLSADQSLSSTIRLHQLKQTPPPVDKGVLMVYNTGNLEEVTTDNSIFSYSDIKPYLSDNRLAKYDLPLDVAYPAYGWSIVYRHRWNNEYAFERIMRRTDFSAYPNLMKLSNNLYEASSKIVFNFSTNTEDYVNTRDRIRVEIPKIGDILKVKGLIDEQLKGKKHNNILYHLDEKQLSHYTDNEISTIYSHD